MLNIFLWVCIFCVILNIARNPSQLRELKKSATLTIIIINVIMFGITLGGTMFCGYLGNSFYYTIGHFQLYRLLTSMFCHFGLTHLFCNMLSLMSIGLAIETTYGKKKMWTIYLSTGIIGGLLSVLMHGLLHDNVLSVGASGAICGLMGYIISKIIKNKNNRTKTIIAVIAPLLLIGVCGGNVDNIAHFSSFFVGILIGFVL